MDQPPICWIQITILKHTKLLLVKRPPKQNIVDFKNLKRKKKEKRVKIVKSVCEKRTKEIPAIPLENL